MVEDYLSDREQEEALRNWWRENWRWIIGGVVLGFGLLGAYKYWETSRDREASDSASMYRDFSAALQAKDADKAKSVLDGLASGHADSPYTQQARLMLAKNHVEAGRYDEALALLRTVNQESKDVELAQVAQLRAARVLIQQGKFDEALASLNVEKAGAFVAQVREIRGDALVAKGDKEGARAEYAAALANAGDPQVDRSMLELKLQDVGGQAPAADNQGALK
jgi:predicted negative regulator of RcsB-dependent stress response